ncbi:filamentous hemagglutinin N-terminal domain-containing protein [Arsenophonus sp.]|uniref:filamentous hemagglutinin N-terminal domain-containing protein n=1 Tax=Arsenophonus sp. TaxID=1872640 RepID=UPI00285738F4|nr:filamentous hemagglutinin N-terminal domain-containing protein [Arsenophonus sp.]MDR5609756.1 filamentous hemagglutinin N-terminal domain-containing protein [Arsenophonus sp.]MDR5613464.1 filamentous hemagglutinin N-terminal domain-containing protein [Arsenophonus sp.]
MYLSKNNNHKLNLLALTISFSGNIFASELSLINNNSVSLKQPTEIISSNKEINLKSTNKSLTINILPAVSKGQFKISHNIYEKFNVNEYGIKINNATNTPANLIISEVISAEKSNINGNITILGNNKPHLIIANPNGINCSNRCSMTNVNTVSLITSPFEENKPSNQLIDNMREKHIHFKNINQENFTDANKIQLLARSVKLESSQLNVNNITIAVDDNNVINNSVSPMTKLSATKAVHITDNNLQNSRPSRNARLTIDRHSAINSKHSYFKIKNGIFNNAGTLASNQNSHYEIINGKFYNNGTINNIEMLVITGINANIDNQSKIKAKNSHFLIRNGKFNNSGKIKNTELIEIFADNSNINNQAEIKSKNGIYEIKNGQFYNSGIIDHSEKMTIKGNNAYINNQFILTSAKYDLTELKSSRFVDFSFVLPHKRNSNNSIELDFSENVM